MSERPNLKYFNSIAHSYFPYTKNKFRGLEAKYTGYIILNLEWPFEITNIYETKMLQSNIL